jgi:hypothetical protein
VKEIQIGSLVSLHGEMGVVIDVFDNTGVSVFIAEVVLMNYDTGDIVHETEVEVKGIRHNEYFRGIPLGRDREKTCHYSSIKYILSGE